MEGRGSYGSCVCCPTCYLGVGCVYYLLFGVSEVVTTENVEMATSNKAEEVLATVLQKAMEVAEKTGDFVTEQAPDVVQQLLAWKFAEAAVIAVVALVSFVLLVRFVYRMAVAQEVVDYDLQSVGAASGIIAAILCLVFGSAAFMNALQIWLAPKVYLIEYTASLLK